MTWNTTKPLTKPLDAALRITLEPIYEIGRAEYERRCDGPGGVPIHVCWEIARTGVTEHRTEEPDLSVMRDFHCRRRSGEMIAFASMYAGWQGAYSVEALYRDCVAERFSVVTTGPLAGQTLGPFYGIDDHDLFFSRLEDATGDEWYVFDDIPFDDPRVESARNPWEALASNVVGDRSSS